MAERDDTRLPEGFAEFLEDNGIPCPPVPLSALGMLDRTDDNFFATDMRSVSFVPLWPEDMDAVLDDRPGGQEDAASVSAEGAGPESENAADLSASSEHAPLDGRGYVGFGLAGGGFQGQRVLFLMEEGALRFGLSLPWNRAFGDPEEEREELEAAFRLAEVCLCRRPGDGAGSGVLRVFVNDEGCRWSLTGEGAEREGDDVDGLLDCLEAGESGCGENVPFSMWMRV